METFSLKELQTLRYAVAVRVSQLHQLEEDPYPHVREQAQADLADLKVVDQKLLALVEDAEADALLAVE